MKPPPGPQVLLDVRDFHRQGQEPFGTIMQAVESLAEDEQFVLLNTFEPLPLYKVLGRQGFKHYAEQTEDGSWRITFWRE